MFLVVVTATVPSFFPANGTCTISRNAQVCVPLAADFSSVVNCQTVSFSDLSTYLAGANPVSWQWSFGDTGSSTSQNPIHTYPPAGGPFIVTLTVTNAAGCQATITKTVNVPGRPTPTVSANPSPACVGEPVAFSAVGPNIVTWLWDFNDGATNGSQNPSHTYLTANTYSISLAVVDNMGCKDTAYLPLIVHPAPPLDTISWSPSLTVCAGTPVTLFAPTGTGYTYLWSDNSTTPTITVTTSGTYSVVVTDANGCSYTPDSVVVTVLPLPSASISGPAFICDAGCVTLNASTGFGYTYQWLDPANIPIGGEVNPTLVVCDFNLLPAYSVVVTDANGCSATSAQHTVALAVSPAFVISVAPLPPCEGMPVTLTITSPQPDVVYSWNTGGTGTSITVIQAGTYTAVGTDTITGCKGTASAIVYPLPDLCLVPAGCYKSCDPDTICGPDGLAAYQWNLNGVPIPGETNQCLIVTQSGTYSLTGTTAFGCSLTSDSLMLMVINCDCGSLSASAEPSEEDSCCWTLSFTNNFGGLFGVQIHTTDADFVFDLGSLDNSLAVFSIAANSIGLVNSQTGSPLPSGTLAGFLDFCFDNVVNSPQQVIFDWYDFDLKVVCSDTLVFDCPVEPDCLYLQSDSIWCEGKDVRYSMTVCNPTDADFAVAYIVIQPSSPTGIVVAPNTIDETANPIQPGECRTYTLALSGTGIAGQRFCYSLTAHDAVPAEIDTTLCCMLDTAYCIPIPDCNPCDDIGVELVEALSAHDGKCCYSISLFNNFAPGYFDGIGLCILSPGTTMTMNNPFGSGWFTASYSPTVIDLNVGPPIGGSLPIGLIQLPQICVQTSSAPSQFLEIKWMAGDSVICRDTIELGCEPPCGYIRDEAIVCDPVTGAWVWAGAIKNTSPYTMGEAHIVFTSPAGMSAYNTTIPLGTLVPGGTQTYSLNLGAPAQPGDVVCFTVALHALDDDAGHTQCCNFSDCIVLPDCDPLTPVADEKFLLFPNPSGGQVFVRYTPKWTAGVRVRVFDMPGRGVLDQEFPDAAGQELVPLQLGILAKGLYTIVVESGGKKWVEKLVID
ncbi:MAG: PKD domain-containing protein [Lewinellaceae bacterium]|nr:PKD domain-containing protein [Lewinellaceae bacterium]